MTLVVVIAVGIMGTLLFSYLAYRNWASSVPTQRTRPRTTVVVAQPTVANAPPTHRRWLPPRWVVVTTLIVVAIYAPITWFSLWPWSTKGDRPRSSFSGLPADVALPIIAQCESGGRQFDDRGYLIKNPTSSAIGKYQIMASLHEARARSLGYDIRTLEGNEGYARFLYAESGTQHWEADPRSRACWEPKLLALGHGGAPPVTTSPPVIVSRPAKVLTLVPRPEQPVSISIPPGHRWDWAGETPDKSQYSTIAYRDRRHNRIQIFQVVLPAKEVRLAVVVTKCASPRACAW